MQLFLPADSVPFYREGFFIKWEVADVCEALRNYKQGRLLNSTAAC